MRCHQDHKFSFSKATSLRSEAQTGPLQPRRPIRFCRRSHHPIGMKTRDQPNLSHCHGCGLRVNATNPKDRLQTLDSVWRIVLLCRRCTKLVESAKLCSYCFSEIEADCFRCRDCERRVHGDCVAKFRSFAPWSYCCPELGFSVCIDCWVPKLLANSNRVYKRRRIKNKNNVLKPNNMGASRGSDNNGGPRSVEDAVAVKAKESEFRKVAIDSSAGELVDGEVGFLAKKDENGAKNEYLNSSDSDSTTMVVDDAELSSQMHLAVNRSPRISKNLCTIESSFLTYSRRRDRNDNLLVRPLGLRRSNNGVCGKIELCANYELIKNTNGTVPGHLVCLRASNDVSPISLSVSKWKGIVYTRRCKKNNESRKNIDVIVGDCNPSNGNSQISEFQSCKRHDELHPDDIRNQSPLRGDGNAAILDDGRCSGKVDRYKLKYGKRPVGLKTNSRSNWKLDRYMLKYSRRHIGLKMISRCNEKVDRCMLKLQQHDQIVKKGRWKWPYPRTRELKEIITNHPPDYTPNPNKHDQLTWTASRNGVYSATTTWRAIRVKKSKVEWHHLVWYVHHIPRHSFILWLAINGRLNVKERMLSWGMNLDPSCVLCGLSLETMDHLFFKCPFSAELRAKVLSKCSILKAVQPWKNEITWAKGKFSGKHMNSTICKLAWGGLIYHLWEERNTRIFKGRSSSIVSIVKKIEFEVKARLSHQTLNVVYGHDSIANSWGLISN